MGDMMVDLKLPKLPDRKMVRIAINVNSNLKQKLEAYVLLFFHCISAGVFPGWRATAFPVLGLIRMTIGDERAHHSFIVGARRAGELGLPGCVAILENANLGSRNVSSLSINIWSRIE
jgi:hypothetical protein